MFDDKRRRLLLLEGPPEPPADMVPRPLRIWEWRDAQWQLIDGTGPRRVSAEGATFDTARAVLVAPVFLGPDIGTWEWDGVRWTKATAEGPVPRSHYALAFAPASRQVVMVGGRSHSPRTFLADAWSWDGSRWHALSLAGATAPGPRVGGSLMHDPRTDRLLLFSGTTAAPFRSEIWSIAKSGWVQLR